MIPRHPALAPARRGAFSVFSATSTISVFIPALLTIRPSMLTLRSAATKGRSTFIRAKIDPLFSYACALFHFPYLVTPLFATLTKTTGVCTNSSQNGTSRLLPERNSHESPNCYRRQRLQLRPASLSVSHRQRSSLPHGHLCSAFRPLPQTRR